MTRKAINFEFTRVFRPIKLETGDTFDGCVITHWKRIHAMRGDDVRDVTIKNCATKPVSLFRAVCASLKR
jgi:hypothetical protein